MVACKVLLAVVEIITTLMPYEKLKASNLNEQIDPEHTVRAGAVKLQFSGRLKARAAQVNSLLESILKELKTVYHDDLPDGIIVRLLPRDASGWMGGVTFVAGAYSQGSGLARDLSRAVALYALFPRGEWVSYPPWVEYGWCDLVALRVCFRAGFRREAEAWRKDHQKAFDPSGKDANAVDLSVSRNRGRGDYIGKSQWLLEVLEKQYGKDLLNRLRTTLAQHAAAGKLPSGVSTRQMICFLSVTVQENLFGYFLSIGTNVLPMKLDLPGGGGGLGPGPWPPPPTRAHAQN